MGDSPLPWLQIFKYQNTIHIILMLQILFVYFSRSFDYKSIDRDTKYAGIHRYTQTEDKLLFVIN